MNLKVYQLQSGGCGWENGLGLLESLCHHSCISDFSLFSVSVTSGCFWSCSSVSPAFLVPVSEKRLQVTNVSTPLCTSLFNEKPLAAVSKENRDSQHHLDLRAPDRPGNIMQLLLLKKCNIQASIF